MSQERAPATFPIGLWSVLLAAVAGYGIYNTVRDVMFFSQTEPTVLRSAADLGSLQGDTLAEAHLPLDIDEAQMFQFSRSSRTFIVIPFQGTGNRLFYAVEQPEDGEDPAIELPLRGRVGTKGLDGDWAIADGKDVDLNELFPDVPDDAFVIRNMTRSGVTPWQWFITGVAVLYLLYLAFRTAAWAVGSRPSHGPADPDTHAAEGGASPPPAAEPQ